MTSLESLLVAEHGELSAEEEALVEWLAEEALSRWESERSREDEAA